MCQLGPFHDDAYTQDWTEHYIPRQFRDMVEDARQCFERLGPAVESYLCVTTRFSHTAELGLTPELLCLLADAQVLPSNSTTSEALKAVASQLMNCACRVYAGRHREDVVTELRHLIARSHLEILGGLPPRAGNEMPEFFLRAYCDTWKSLPTAEQFEQFVDVYNARVITNRTKRGRKLGFSRPMTVQALRGFLETPGTYLLVLELPDRVPFGLGLLQTEVAVCCSEVRYIVAKLSALRHIAGQRVGWARFVVLSKVGARMLSRLRVRGEQLLVEVALHLAAARQIRALFSKVRVNTFANPAIIEHLRCGFERTGVRLEPGEISPEAWEVLRLDPYSVQRAARWESISRWSPIAGRAFGGN